MFLFASRSQVYDIQVYRLFVFHRRILGSCAPIQACQTKVFLPHVFFTLPHFLGLNSQIKTPYKYFWSVYGEPVLVVSPKWSDISSLSSLVALIVLVEQFVCCPCGIVVKSDWSGLKNTKNMFLNLALWASVSGCVCKRIFWRRWCDTEIFIWSFIAFQIH
jgi:hypothetical protein